MSKPFDLTLYDLVEQTRPLRGEDVIIELLTKFIDREGYSVEDLGKYFATHLTESEMTLPEIELPANVGLRRRAFPELEPLK